MKIMKTDDNGDDDDDDHDDKVPFPRPGHNFYSLFNCIYYPKVSIKFSRQKVIYCPRLPSSQHLYYVFLPSFLRVKTNEDQSYNTT